VIFSIDHIVFAADAAESTDLRDSLAETGFQREEFTLEFPEIGATSESLSFASGGFVEFVVGSDRQLAPEVWFADTPRVIGLGFSSNDFAADTWWSSEPRAWVMNEDHLLPDGSRLTIHAAGPHEHSSEFYVFVMDRPDGRLQFSERTDGPRLNRLKFTGADADAWEKRLREWLRLPARKGALLAGQVELTFDAGDRPGVRISPVFDAGQNGSLPLSASAIELVARGGSGSASGAEDRER
jgi:hypothetical protein